MTSVWSMDDSAMTNAGAPPVRVTFIISHMREGGAERVTALMANYWAARGWPVQLIMERAEPEEDSLFPLHPRVQCRKLAYMRVTRAALPKLRKLQFLRVLRQAIRDSDPQVIIAIMDATSIRALLATLGMQVPVLVAEHCDPNMRPMPPFEEWLRRRLYPHAAAVVALSDSAMRFFSPAVQWRGRIIPNPVVLPAGGGMTHREHGGLRATRTVISAGRLCAIKGFDRLLCAFAHLAPRIPNWRLDIWGDGPEQESLQQLIRERGLEDRIVLPGWTDDIYDKLHHADLFALSSYTEGFPMAIAEAMACGLPVVSFDCPSGPRQLVRHGIDGLLVPDGDVDALAQALERLMRNDGERAAMGKRALEVTERFHIDRVMDMWDALIRDVIR